MNDEEKLNYLTEAGGVRFIPERSVIKVLSEEMKSAAFPVLPQELLDAVSGWNFELCGDAALYGAENLVEIVMPDDGMFPEIISGDLVMVAFREEVREGDWAAVASTGSETTVTVREIRYEEDHVRLIPKNKAYPAACCSPDQVLILGRVVEGGWAF